MVSVPLPRRRSECAAASMSRTSTSPRNDIVAGPTRTVTVPLKLPPGRRSVIFAPGMQPGHRLDVLQEFPGDVGRARQRKRLLELDLHARYRLLTPSALHCCQTR